MNQALSAVRCSAGRMKGEPKEGGVTNENEDCGMGLINQKGDARLGDRGC